MAAVVETGCGRLEGLREEGLFVFRGVPFGVVQERLGRARVPEAWAGVRKAHAFGPWAPQNGGDVLFQLKPHALGEDCLQLNVWTPGLDAARRPVMVWIHGGGFTNGSGTSPVYDGRRLALDGDVVVVTINYRLGALGFLRLVDLSAGRVPSTGNEGLEDQVLALRWVAENIERFGGDPDNVTLFGESAGGMSVGCHLAMAASEPLFHKAIAQSGACHGANDPDRANAFAEETLAALGVAPAEAERLRDMPIERILKAQQDVQVRRSRVAGRRGMAYGPVIDGKTLEAHPLARVRDGSAQGKPLLVGTTLEEWRLFAYVRPSELSITDERLRRRLQALLPLEHVDRVLEAYAQGLAARGVSATPFELSCAIQTDRMFRIPAIRLAEAQREHQDAVFAYCFDWPSALGKTGACHALELGFVFGTHSLPGSVRFCGRGPQADRLSERMREAWTQFARTGDPGWPAYGRERATRWIGASWRTELDPQGREREVWDGQPEAVGVF